ncbi:MAG: Holliday junction resolvase RuvX [Ignavibacteriae bacterium]|nr:Holliday junction resolvase RuvX [Ignavibacteria bacterium]MBI3365621.1 Holliday junction resolvase RuvX [Ignavibacteriota bacterium]
MKKRLLGIDYGSRRIGVAVSDPLNVIARGVTVIENSPRALGEIQRLADEFDVERIVVGFPLNLKGERGFKAKEVEEFIQRLTRELHREVVRCDERFSTKLALQTMHTMGVKKKKRQQKGIVDEMAAALILQQYLDSHPSSEER